MKKSRAIAKNSAYLYLRMLIVLGTSLYTVRVVLDALGVKDFGIYALAGGIVAIFAFLNATMTRAAQRFLGIEIGKGEEGALNRTFNAILFANGVLALCVALLGLTVGLWLLNSKLNIPAGRLGAANVVMMYSIATTVALIIRTPYSALIISHQKMWFFSTTSVLEAALKLAVAFAISHTDADRLELYGALTCAVSWLLLVCYVIFCRLTFSESRFQPHRNLALYSELLKFTGWSFIGNIAHVLRTHGVNLLLNVFFGTSLNAAYGVMAQAQNAATQFTSSFELALSPQIYKSYGQGDARSVESLVFIGSKLNFILLAVLAAPAIYGMDYLLQLWLGQAIPYLAAFVTWMLLTQLVETASQPLMVAALATGQIKRYQLAVGGTILLNLPLSWLAFRLGLGPMAFLYIAFLIQLVTFTLRVAFLRSMIGLHTRKFAVQVILRLIAIAAVAVCLTGGAFFYAGPPRSFYGLAAWGSGIAASVAAASFVLGLTSTEKSMFFEILRRKKAR